MPTTRIWLLFVAACAVSEKEDVADLGTSDVEQGVEQTAANVVINEFTAGSAGKIELYNTGDATADLSGWQVDDVGGGGYAPKTLAAGTTLAGHQYLVVTYAGINYASTDQVRLVDPTGVQRDAQTNFYSGTSTNGLCFGRQPDGGAWATGSLACTFGGANGCATSGACNDGNNCSTGETIQADCTCGGGQPLNCDDGNPCTGDLCTQADGCRNDPVADGTACGSNATCQAGVCTAAPPPATDHAELLTFARRDRVLLKGVVVGPSGPFTGEVLVDGELIVCAASSCAGHPAAVDASVVRTNGVIFPGMIDAHNHILFDIFNEDDWAPTKLYGNHNQWPNDTKYKAMVDAKQYMNGEGSPMTLGCEMNKYGELKGLIAGTTSIQGSANPADKACYGSVARTIDQAPNDLGFDKIQTATIFPTRSSADAVCSNESLGKTDAYAIHIGEGVDAAALKEYASLGTITTTPNCLYNHKTTIIHGTAFGDAEMTSMAANGMSLVWSPRSNVFLYGKTTNIPMARGKGINIALAPDWSIGGSQNMLDELRFADQVDNAQYGNILSSRDLVDMVTINAAKALGVDNVLGSIEVGKKADLFVVPGDLATAYDSLLAATPKTVRLTMVNGRVLYGDAAVQQVGADNQTCETLDVCTGAKFVCVAESGATVSNKLGQTFAEIKSALDTGMKAYDDLNLSPFDFAPIAPLVRCQ